ncbi:hypothetical protein SRHO_G00242540 [Serrasalmus rhombeus]
MILKNMVYTWKQVRRLEGFSNCFSLLTPLHKNPDFPPGLNSGLSGWKLKGIQVIGDIVQNGDILSLQELRDKFDIPESDFLRIHTRHLNQGAAILTPFRGWSQPTHGDCSSAPVACSRFPQLTHRPLTIHSRSSTSQPRLTPSQVLLVCSYSDESTHLAKPTFLWPVATRSSGYSMLRLPVVQPTAAYSCPSRLPRPTVPPRLPSRLINCQTLLIGRE